MSKTATATTARIYVARLASIHSPCKTATATTAHIYVACLASYNAGILHGEWIDASDDPEDMQASIDAMLSRSRQPDAEEWAIHDYDAPFSIGEYSSLDEIAEFVAFIEEHDEPGIAALQFSVSLADAKTLMDGFHGVYDSMRDYAEEYAESCIGVPDHIWPYFDVDALARDLEIELCVHRHNDCVYVFSA